MNRSDRPVELLTRSLCIRVCRRWTMTNPPYLLFATNKAKLSPSFAFHVSLATGIGRGRTPVVRPPLSVHEVPHEAEGRLSTSLGSVERWKDTVNGVSFRGLVSSCVPAKKLANDSNVYKPFVYPPFTPLFARTMFVLSLSAATDHRGDRVAPTCAHLLRSLHFT